MMWSPSQVQSGGDQALEMYSAWKLPVTNGAAMMMTIGMMVLTATTSPSLADHCRPREERRASPPRIIAPRVRFSTVMSMPARAGEMLCR